MIQQQQQEVVLLDTEDFVRAIHRYQDENKPDPELQRHMQKWTFAWRNDYGNAVRGVLGSTDRATPGTLSTTAPRQQYGNLYPEEDFQPTHVLSGTLSWGTEYIEIALSCHCQWSTSLGLLYFCCWVSDGRFLLSSPSSSTPTPATTVSTKQNIKTNDAPDDDHNADEQQQQKAAVNKQEERIRTRMIQRLRQDDYILKLMPSSSSGADRKICCEAYIKYSSSSTQNNNSDSGHHEESSNSRSSNDLLVEERVDTSPILGEALRRALFPVSVTENSLDVYEVLFSLPLLPCTDHNNNNNSTSHPSSTLAATTTTTTTPLANRAKLRLLEDAMCDACELYGDDDIVSDLEISPSSSLGQQQEPTRAATAKRSRGAPD